MMGFIRQHAIALGLLLVLGVVLLDCAGKSDRLEQARVWEDSAAVYRGQWRALAADTARLAADLRLATEQAERAYALADSIDAITPRVLVRWDTLPADATAAEVRVAADSTVEHLRAASEHWREAFLARTAELRALEAQGRNLAQQLAAATGEVEALRAANVELRDEATRRPSAWVPVAFIGGGALIGGATAGVEGAAWGAAGGTVATVGYFGVGELLRVRLRLPDLPWPL